MKQAVRWIEAGGGERRQQWNSMGSCCKLSRQPVRKLSAQPVSQPKVRARLSCSQLVDRPMSVRGRDNAFGLDRLITVKIITDCDKR